MTQELSAVFPRLISCCHIGLPRHRMCSRFT